MKKRIAIALCITGTVFLAACGGGSGSTAPGHGGKFNNDLYVRQVQVDGRTVNCVVYSDMDYQQGGVSCDFGGAR